MSKHLLVIFILICNIGNAQDIHFSQYRHTPLLLNPALTSNNSGDWQAGFNFREQWTRTAIPYNTFNIFFDKKMYVYSKLVLVGGYLTVDQLNTKGLTKILVSPSVAYRIDYMKNNFKIGLQPGIGFYNRNSVLSHPDQFSYETGTFDTDIPTSDLSDNLSRVFADINIGLIWSREIAGLAPQVGWAMYHVNRPKSGIYASDKETRMPVKHLISFELPLSLLQNTEITPMVLAIRQRKSQEIILGAEASYKTDDVPGGIDKLILGIHYRNARSEGLSSVVFMGGLEFNHILLAISYDEYFNVVKNTSAIGSSFELSVIYSGINSFTDQFSIPCDIY